MHYSIVNSLVFQVEGKVMLVYKLSNFQKYTQFIVKHTVLEIIL